MRRLPVQIRDFVVVRQKLVRRIGASQRTVHSAHRIVIGPDIVEEIPIGFVTSIFLRRHPRAYLRQRICVYC